MLSEWLSGWVRSCLQLEIRIKTGSFLSVNSEKLSRRSGCGLCLLKRCLDLCLTWLTRCALQCSEWLAESELQDHSGYLEFDELQHEGQVHEAPKRPTRPSLLKPPPAVMGGLNHQLALRRYLTAAAATAHERGRGQVE